MKTIKLVFLLWTANFYIIVNTKTNNELITLIKRHGNEMPSVVHVNLVATYGLRTHNVSSFLQDDLQDEMTLDIQYLLQYLMWKAGMVIGQRVKEREKNKREIVMKGALLDNFFFLFFLLLSLQVDEQGKCKKWFFLFEFDKHVPLSFFLPDTFPVFHLSTCAQAYQPLWVHY